MSDQDIGFNNKAACTHLTISDLTISDHKISKEKEKQKAKLSIYKLQNI